MQDKDELTPTTMATGEQNPAHDTCPPNQANLADHRPPTSKPSVLKPGHLADHRPPTSKTQRPQTRPPRRPPTPHIKTQRPQTRPPRRPPTPHIKNPASSNQATSQTHPTPHIKTPAHDTCPQKPGHPSDHRPRAPPCPARPGFRWTEAGDGVVVFFQLPHLGRVVDGIGFSVGIFFSSFEKEFGSNKQQTSWVSSALNGTYLIIGLCH